MFIGSLLKNVCYRIYFKFSIYKVFKKFGFYIKLDRFIHTKYILFSLGFLKVKTKYILKEIGL